jgi:hypothetical protein
VSIRTRRSNRWLFLLAKRQFEISRNVRPVFAQQIETHITAYPTSRAAGRTPGSRFGCCALLCGSALVVPNHWERLNMRVVFAASNHGVLDRMPQPHGDSKNLVASFLLGNQLQTIENKQ